MQAIILKNYTKTEKIESFKFHSKHNTNLAVFDKLTKVLKLYIHVYWYI